ncbi:MAG: nitroreductase/uncharacterized protein YndB with AHSA1/START domain [Candidatus Aldehydirespiratoraceae bacterium]|jgi:nitroreductase/uncharacterized protein YndB with AHSA1/START domain
MEITPDLTAAVDHVLSTTRAVRKRLDLDRPVEDQVIYDCIDLAEQSPTGGNQSTRRWMVIRDAEQKKALADLYLEAGGEWIIASYKGVQGTGHHNEKVLASAAHLAENLEHMPAIVMVGIWGEHDNSGRPGLFDSVIQGAWSFCLALRARGLGSAWTTVHLGKAAEIRDLIGMPEGITQIVLLPVAYTVGTEFKAAPRISAREITYVDRWGDTMAANADGPVTFAAGPGVTVEVETKATPKDLWPFVSDPDLLARWSDEFQGASWDDEPGEGTRFAGRNAIEGFGEWETSSVCVAYRPNREFGWKVQRLDADEPGTQWRLELVPLAGGTRLRFAMRFGPGSSGLTWNIDSEPERETDIIRDRQNVHRTNMQRCAEGIVALAEEAASA